LPEGEGKAFAKDGIGALMKRNIVAGKTHAEGEGKHYGKTPRETREEKKGPDSERRRMAQEKTLRWASKSFKKTRKKAVSGGKTKHWP